LCSLRSHVLELQAPQALVLELDEVVGGLREGDLAHVRAGVRGAHELAEAGRDGGRHLGLLQEPRLEHDTRAEQLHHKRLRDCAEVVDLGEEARDGRGGGQPRLVRLDFQLDALLVQLQSRTKEGVGKGELVDGWM
jgi:hypothetical protein